MAESIFTRIIKREIPAEFLFEDDDVVAIRDVNPQAPVHFLVVPQRPIPTLNDITETDGPLIGKMFMVARELAAAEGIAEDGYRTVFNCNAGAGQTVFHLHLHVLGGRPMRWPPG